MFTRLKTTSVLGVLLGAVAGGGAGGRGASPSPQPRSYDQDDNEPARRR
jgi:hypothetical protein